MKRRWWPVCILLFVLLTCTLAAGFLLGTTAGARLVLGQVARVSGAAVGYETITGELGHSLVIEGLRLRMGGVTLRAGVFRLAWQPFHLLSGRVAIKELYARAIVVEDARPESPIDLTWPDIPRWAGLIQGSIAQLRIDGFRYQVPGTEPLDLHSVTSSVLWDTGRLLLEGLSVTAPSGSLEGNLGIGVVRPGLRARLTALPKTGPKPRSSRIDRIVLETDLSSTVGVQPISGKTSLTMYQRTKESMRLDSRLVVSPHSIEFKELLIRTTGIHGSINATGTIDLSKVQPTADLRAQITNLSLPYAIKNYLVVSGNISATSDFRTFRGAFDVRSSGDGWKRARLAGTMAGSADEVRVRLVEGALLDGQVEGEVLVRISERYSLEGTLRGKNINPGVMRPDLKGIINMRAGLKLEGSDTSDMAGHVDAELLESRFLGRPLTGRVAASLTSGILRVSSCEVHGNGFDLSARGTLQERLTYEIGVRDLSGLIPEARGRVSGSGWFRWVDGMPAGVLKASGNMLSFGQVSARSVDLGVTMEKGLEGPLDAAARVQGLAYQGLTITTGSAEVRGMAGDHSFSLTGSWHTGDIAVQGRGSYAEKNWRGTLARFDVRHAPLASWRLQKEVSMLVSSTRLHITPCVLVTGQGEQIDLSSDLNFNPQKGSAALAWRAVDLSRLSPFLKGQQAAGQSSGSLTIEWSDRGLPRIAGSLGAAGRITQGGLVLEIEQANLNLAWNERGLLSSWDVRGRSGARLSGTASSPEPARAGLPEQTTFQMMWENIDLALLKPLYPDQLAASGLVSGRMSGSILPEQRIALHGETSVSQGRMEWRTADGLMSTTLDTARLAWEWRDTELTGKANLLLSDSGHVSASFRLPIIARLPVSVNRDSPVQASVKGQLYERGILTALFPGLIQESKGTFTFDLSTNGTWTAPALRGTARLSGAAAYLPSAGIHLQDAGADITVSDNQIRVTSFSVRSGPGSVKGSATALLRDGRLEHLEGRLTGERFQAIYLPELQALIDPDLRFEGSGTSLTLLGTIKVPQLRIYLPDKGGVRASTDVILTDAKAKSTTRDAPDLKSEVRIILGEKVTVQAMGINARLEGNLLVKTKGFQDVTAQGEIRIPEGQYSASGVKLDVTRGTVTFNGGPPERGVIDVLALKKLPPTPKVKEVKAGVIITGNLQAPVVKLYSDPAMAEADVLSYILVGRPRSADTEQSVALARAAAAMAAAGPSDSVMNKLGLDMMDVETPKGDTKQTYVSLGKYISPRLYLGLGYSLFRQESFLTARYTLSKNWEVESQSGAQLAADLYYKIEFY